MAPVAGRYFAAVDLNAATAIVADTGGTSFDVSLVRDGRIPWTRETWLGQPYRGHMTGFPSTDVKSIGAGGGSIAWVDEGGMLHVGPQSAGASPGPACYGQDGKHATVTDSALVLGLLDADYFLGGRMKLDIDAARRAIETDVSGPLGFDVEAGAAAVMSVMTENMVQAIGEITIHQGVDPRNAVLIAGGGAAGLNIVSIARRLGCADIVVPNVGAVLSAAGGLMAELGDDYSATFPATSAEFDLDGVNGVLDSLAQRCDAFVEALQIETIEQRATFFAEARYAHQVWEIEVPLPTARFGSAEDVQRLVEEFHSQHEAVFAVRDPDSEVEIIHWHARVRCTITQVDAISVASASAPPGGGSRRVVLPGVGAVDAKVVHFDDVSEARMRGPAVVESPFTSVVIEPDVSFARSASGSLWVQLGGHSGDADVLAGKSW
jgi:N-methylhydantoinase A